MLQNTLLRLTRKSPHGAMPPLLKAGVRKTVLGATGALLEASQQLTESPPHSMLLITVDSKATISIWLTLLVWLNSDPLMIMM